MRHASGVVAAPADGEASKILSIAPGIHVSVGGITHGHRHRGRGHQHRSAARDSLLTLSRPELVAEASTALVVGCPRAVEILGGSSLGDHVLPVRIDKREFPGD